MSIRNRKKRPINKKHLNYIASVIEELNSHPEKLNIIKENCDRYKQQIYLKKGLLLAIERFEWVFEVDDDVERICVQIMADDYIGNRIRRYPLLFKGVLND
jgi:hypothetical protein